MTPSIRPNAWRLAFASSLFALVTACGGDVGPDMAPGPAPAPVPAPAPAPPAVAPAWQAPVGLQNPAAFVGLDPHVVVDDQGNATAVWDEQIAGGIKQVWTRRYTPAGGWGTAEQLSASGGVVAEQARLAVNADGHVLAIWAQASMVNFSSSEIWSRRFTPAGGWEPLMAVRGNTGVPVRTPQIGMDRAGNAVAVWQEGFLNETIGASRYTAGVGWSAPTHMEPTTTQIAREPQVAVNGDGEVVVVWLRRAGDIRTPEEAWANRYTPADGWGTATRIGSGNAAGLVLDEAGNAMVLLNSFNATTEKYEAWFTRYSRASGWSSPALAHNNASNHAYGKRLASGPGGATTAAFVQQVGSGAYLVLARTYTPVLGWGALQTVGTTGFRPNVSLAEDGQGKATLMWTLDAGELMTSERDATGDWSVAKPLRDGQSGADLHHLVTNANGDRVALWRESVGTFSYKASVFK